MPQATSPLFNVGIIILAAGLGRRFAQAGGEGHKLLAPFPDNRSKLRPLLDITLANAVASGLPVQLVTRPEFHELIALARQWPVGLTLLESQGSGESIAAGVNDTRDWKGWIIQPADMPWIKSDDYRRVAAALVGPRSQVRLKWQGLPGHPVGFGAGWQKELLALEGDQGARQLMKAEHLVILAGGAGNLLDADLPTR